MTVSKRVRWLLVAFLPLDLLFVIVVVCVILNEQTPAATDIKASPALRTAPDALRAPVTLKIVTFNVWDLYQKSEHRAERMPAIGKKLAELNPDIVGLQEAWVARDRETILAALRPIGLEHIRYFRSGLVGSGLLVASRFPIEEAHFQRFTGRGKPYRVDQGDYWAGKGICLVRLRLPEGMVDFFDTHAHAAYRDPGYDGVRLSNMRQAASFVAAAAAGSIPAFVVGDFNTHAGEEQYKALIEGARLTRVMAIPTRIDHVFAVENAHYTFEVLDTQAIAQELEANGEKFGLSDHEGYMTTVRVTPAG